MMIFMCTELVVQKLTRRRHNFDRHTWIYWKAECIIKKYLSRGISTKLDSFVMISIALK